MTGPEFTHATLTRAELAQAARQCGALAVHSRGELAASWRRLAAALHALVGQRDPGHRNSRGAS